MECQSYIKKTLDNNDTLYSNVIMVAEENKQTYKNKAGHRLTLLESFVRQKMKSYVTPEKKGVPRGQSIGFPYKKYFASLLLLSSTPLKEIANGVKAPYGSLRNWCTEERFIKLVNEHAKKFAELLLKHIEEKTNKREQEQGQDGFLRKSIEEIVNMSLPKRDMKELEDMPAYSDGLLFEIVKVLGKKLYSIQKLNNQLELNNSSERLLEIVKAKGFHLAYQEIPEAKKILNKFLEHYDTCDAYFGDTPLTSEILSVLSMILYVYDIPRRRRRYTGINKTSEAIDLRSLSSDSYKRLILLQKNILKGVIRKLLKKPIKEKDRKSAVYLLTVLLQALK